MFQSSDNITGSPTFTTAVAKQADGTYTATCVSRPEVPAINRPSEAEAMLAMKQALERFVVSNGR